MPMTYAQFLAAVVAAPPNLVVTTNSNNVSNAMSLFTNAGGVQPTTPTGHDNTAFSVLDPFINGKTNPMYLGEAECLGGNATPYLLMDRLVSSGNGTAASTTAVAYPASGAWPSLSSLTGNATGERAPLDGVGLLMMVEIYAVPGTTGFTVSIGYLNETGGASSTSVAIPASAPVRTVYPVPLAPGDRGITAITSIAAGSVPTAGAANSFGVTLFKPTTFFSIRQPSAGIGYGGYDNGLLGGCGDLAKLHPNGCYHLLALVNTGGANAQVVYRPIEVV